MVIIFISFVLTCLIFAVGAISQYVLNKLLEKK